MAIFLDDIKPMRLYKTKFYLPIDKTDRKNNALVFLLTKNLDQSLKLMKNPMFINIHSYMSYYIESDITLFLNEMHSWISDSENTEFLLESLSKKERDSIDVEDFGLPEDRKYPLDSKEHVKSAIRLFGHCEEDKKPILANNIIKAAKKYKIKINKNTEVYKYSNLSVEESMLLEEVDMIALREFKKINENQAIIDKDFIHANIDGAEFKIYMEEAIDRLLSEASDPRLKHILFNDRMKTHKEQLLIYDYVKEKYNEIKFTFIDLKLYRNRNMFVDFSHYMDTFFRRNMYKLDAGLNVFSNLVSNAIHDKRFDELGYKKKMVFIDVKDWAVPSNEDIFNFKNISPISYIDRMVHRKSLIELQKQFGGIEWVFLSDKAYFKCSMDDLDQMNISRFRNYITKLLQDDLTEVEDSQFDSRDVLLTKFADRLDSRGINIYNITGSSKTKSKEEIMAKLDRLKNNIADEDDADSDDQKAMLMAQMLSSADAASTEDEMYDDLSDKDKQWIAGVIDDIESDEGTVKINKARAARMSKLNQDILKKQLKGKSIKDYLEHKNNKEIPKDNIPIDSINEEWNNITFTNFSPSYNLDDDLVTIFTSMIDKSAPISVIDIDKEDNITSEDYIETWTVKFEDMDGTRFTVKMDIPKFIDGKFMKLRGNLKTLQGQLMLLPVIKTEDDTAQIVSNYNKIFVRRFNPANGSKTTRYQSKLTKILDKYKGNTFKASIGDNSLICKKYELPIEYKDLAASYNRIDFKDGSYILFNMDDMKKKVDAANPKSIIKESGSTTYLIYNNKTKTYTATESVSKSILDFIQIKATESNDKALLQLLEETKPSDKLSYTVASILNTEIPMIVVMAYSEGLQSAMTKGNVKFRVEEKRPTTGEPFVKFKDGYIVYDDSVESSILMNGLSKVDTEFYSIKDINGKEMWTDALDLFGGRAKADGLDNFYDMMIDPITKEVCELYKLPTDYVSILGYASALLADTKYNKHTDISGNRLRTNEIVAGYAYKIMANAYGEYKTQKKRSKGSVTLAIKQSAVVDAILSDPTASDLSVLSPILEAEAANAVTFKGLSGLNSERSYSLDKRLYDESMLGVIGAATGFAGNVGITRQLTVNSNIVSKRGMIQTPKDDKLNTTNMLTVTEALTPYVTTKSDPMRQAMSYVQTAKHMMRVKRSCPNLVTTGMDEALPYITSNMFSYKFKGKRGKVLNVTDRWIVYEDLDTKEKGFVDLEEKTMKNSDGGFYVNLKLIPNNIKKGQILKNNDILAYDPTSFSKAHAIDKNSSNNISFNIGTLAKIAIMPTDEAYNDSTIITESMSESLTSTFIVEKARYLPKDTNIYNLAQKGQDIEEGDPLMIFQNAFEEKDANALLKAISDEDLEAVSDLGRIHVHSKITGKIQNIKIYRTCELDELSPSLRKVVTAYEAKIKKEKAELKKMGIENTAAYLEPDYKLEPTGKLKDCIDGVKIFFYISCDDKMSVGDKLVFSAALKGVVKKVIVKGDEPYTDLRPNEYIESLLTTAGINARMVGSVILEGSINKVMIELDRACKEKLGIKWKNCYDIDTNY